MSSSNSLSSKKREHESSSSSTTTISTSIAKPVIAAFAKKIKKDSTTSSTSIPSSSSSSITELHINSQHLNDQNLSLYTQIFKEGQPFPHIHIKNLFPSEFLHQVKEELLQADYVMKRNDLYDFLQTDALRSMKNNASAKLRDYIYSTEFRKWIERITGVETYDTIDLSAAQYTTGSHLLCHDDDLAARRIAYIIYLVPENWAKEDGGSLDLYNTTNDGMPDSITARLIPQWNSIAFFEVSPISFHQVAEVTTFTTAQAEKGSRMSISGWFHGKPGKRPPMPILPVPQFIIPPRIEDTKDTKINKNSHPSTKNQSQSNTTLENVGHALPLQQYASINHNASSLASSLQDIYSLSYWINPLYLKKSTLQQMQVSYISNASLQLDNFLRHEIYLLVRKVLGTQNWKHIGPPILYSYRKLDLSNTNEVLSSQYNSCLPDILYQLYTFLTSAVFYDYIATLTNTILNGVTGEIRCFSEGDYTLLSDPSYQQGIKAAKANRIGVKHTNPSINNNNSSINDDNDVPEDSVPLLDVTLCCTSEEHEWTDNVGGWITYMTADDELLTVSPKHNSITIVCK